MKGLPDAVAKGRASLAAHRRWLADHPTLKDVRDELAAMHATLRAAFPFAVPESPEQRQPHLCPLCRGWRKVQSPYFTGTTGEMVDCPTCSGEGVLWR